MSTNSQSPTGDRTSLDGVHILIVDDSDELREIIEFVLAARGARVDSACDGAEAISMSQTTSYDLILMDLRMPGLDGRDTAAKIKSRPSKTKIVALTGDLNAMRASAKDSPFDAFISKPIDPGNLSVSIINAVNVKCS